MNWNKLSARVQGVWRGITGPKYKPGTPVKNVFTEIVEVLHEYLSPHVGISPDGTTWVCEEYWLTVNGHIICVGAHWCEIPSPASEIGILVEGPEPVLIPMTRKEVFCLIHGALKGNIAYGSVASAEGKMTLELVERFNKVIPNL